MNLTDKQQKWIIANFKNTKNDEIMLKMNISHSALHRFAREHNLKKSKQFIQKCQAATTEAARLANKQRNWPPKGYKIPNSEKYQFQKGITPLKRLGKRKNTERIRKSAESRKNTVRSEKRRVLFGLPQKTKLKVVQSPHAKIAYRYVLKKRGYIVDRGSKDIYYDENTLRSEIVEHTATKRHGFSIIQYC